MANYVGNMWSSLQEIDDRGNINIVSNEQAVGEQIVAFLLTRQGEDPFAPDYGLDFNLFQNLNDLDGDVWGFYVQGKIQEYIVGLNAVNVRVDVQPVDGKARVYIDYSTDLSNSRNTLTFPYHAYTGFQAGEANLADLLASVSINDNRFDGLR
jgi:hypothetical protein